MVTSSCTEPIANENSYSIVAHRYSYLVPDGSFSSALMRASFEDLTLVLNLGIRIHLAREIKDEKIPKGVCVSDELGLNHSQAEGASCSTE